MKIAEIMTGEVTTVTPETKITEVAKLLSAKGFHGVPVVEKEKLVGIITETDFFSRGENAFHLPSYIEFLNEVGIENTEKGQKHNNMERIVNAKAKDIMTTNCLTINKDDGVEKFVYMVREGGLRTVPVVEGEKLIGIVTLADIIRLM